jgi:parvulin-like peptidyl-prolyl isomerase
VALAGAVMLGLFGRATGQPGMPVARPAAKPVAVVNGKDTISMAQLEAVLKMSGPAPLHLPEAERRQRQFEALSKLLDDLLLRQFLDQKNVAPVDPATLEQAIKEMEAGLRKQGKSLAEYCHDTNQPMEQFRSAVADDLRWRKYALPLATDFVVGQYFQDMRDFFEGTKVKASHIVLRLPLNAPEAERARLQAKLEQLREDIKAGKITFEKAAQTYSQDPRASEGGALDFFPRKWAFDEPFSRAAFSLRKDDISEVVRTDYGLHLIKVTDRQQGEPFDFAANKERVREMYLEEMYQQILAQQRKEAKIEINLP